MTKMDILTQKVKDAIICHTMTSSGACSACPYKNEMPFCTPKVYKDAETVIDYWKGKYENTVLQQPMMIINPNPAPSIIKVESSDIYMTKKYTKALREMGDAGKRASAALREVTDAFKNLKAVLEVFSDD